jgi:hypothetical protein
MKPFVLSLIPKGDIELLEKVRRMIQAFPDEIDLGNDLEGKPIVLSCHILANALGKVLGLDVVDGYFRPHYNHSWLKTPNGHIIDVYPVGILGGPFLVEQTASFLSPGRHLYQPDMSVWERMVAKQYIQRAIDVASKAAMEATR